MTPCPCAAAQTRAAAHISARHCHSQEATCTCVRGSRRKKRQRATRHPPLAALLAPPAQCSKPPIRLMPRPQRPVDSSAGAQYTRASTAHCSEHRSAEVRAKRSTGNVPRALLATLAPRPHPSLLPNLMPWAGRGARRAQPAQPRPRRAPTPARRRWPPPPPLRVPPPRRVRCEQSRARPSDSAPGWLAP